MNLSERHGDRDMELEQHRGKYKTGHAVVGWEGNIKGVMPPIHLCYSCALGQFSQKRKCKMQDGGVFVEQADITFTVESIRVAKAVAQCDMY